MMRLVENFRYQTQAGFSKLKFPVDAFKMEMIMSYEFYKVLHIVGAVIVFLALGSQFMVASGNDAAKKLASIHHGVGLLIMLVAGFGLIAKLQVGFPGWVLVKIVLWVILGGMLTLARRMSNLATLWWYATIAVALIATVLAVYKPF